MDIGKQLLECLKYKNASNKIEELDEKGLLEQIIPSIKDMKEVGKCRYHIVNSFQHLFLIFYLCKQFLLHLFC